MIYLVIALAIAAGWIVIAERRMTDLTYNVCTGIVILGCITVVVLNTIP